MIAAAVHATPSVAGSSPPVSHLALTAPAALADDTPAGRLIGGKYQVVRLLGAGGMGVVHEAINTWTGRRVAVKELHSSFSTDASALHRFTLEAQRASRIAHPNVVDILDLGHDVETGAMFMVQELLTGSTLRERMTTRGALAIDEVVRLIGPALSALVVAHDAGVIHRDLKPDNIFLARDAFDGEIPKIIDFGLAKQLSTDDDLGLTGQGRQLGTPYYMSPEQLRGGALDDRTDVWAMGVVLYEAAAGERPFHGPTYNELVVQILKDPIPRLADVMPTLPPAFTALVERTLAREAAERPTSRELRDALDELGRRPEVLSVPRGNPYRGLLPFESAYRGVFFGRAAEVAAVIDRLRHDPLVLVAGDSGVGKSSLVRAGVLPVVSDAGMPVATCTPGAQPLAALAAALAPILDDEPAALAVALADDVAAVGARLQQVIAVEGDADAAADALAFPAVPRLVLFVDQLEELLTLAHEGDGALAALALAGLLEAAPALRVIATVRSDFLARLAALPVLGDHLTDALYLLKPLTPQGIREAVVGPARITGLRFESPALVDELVASAGTSAGELPLLQFALARLWDLRDVDAGMIRASSLAALGGVAGALAGHADGVLATIPPRHLPLAREVLTALVTEDGTRARRTADELTPEGAAPEAVRVVLEALVQGRLVGVEDAGGAPSYQMAHDVLVEGWGTLRGWRGREIERHATRQRLARAAAEWDRLGRPRDALWQGRQLAEVADLSPRALSGIDAEFLARSRAAVRRGRRVRRALALGLPALVAVGFAGARYQAHRRTAEAIGEHVRAAEDIATRAASTEREVETLRKTAFAAFDGGHSEAGEEAWSQIRNREITLDASYRTAGEHLEAALALDGDNGNVRQRFAALLFDRARLAERTHRASDRDELAHRMATYDDDHRESARWTAPAHLSIATAPAAAITVQRLDERAASLALGTTPVEHDLAPGSYLITLRAADRPEVRAPVLLARGETVKLAPVLPAAIPDGYAYVPAGRFLYGSTDDEDVRRTLMNAQPLHAVTTPGYLIARHEVTFADWIAFLRVLPAAERAQRTPHGSGTAETGAVLELREREPGLFHIALQPMGRRYEADAGEPIRYARAARAEQRWLRMPVSGISWDDANAYAAWLARGGLAGAHPCTDHEWERAARGADGRLFPGGDDLAPDQAAVAETYGRKPDGFGPDEVGSYPASDSVFGVSDLAGNAWEWVASLKKGEVLIRGGSWYHNLVASRANNREPTSPAVRAIAVGMRICADAPGAH